MRAGVKPAAPLPPHAAAVRYRDVGAVETRYYLRLSLLDRPGVLGQVTTILGQHGISIASVLQKEVHAGKHVPVVIVTHRAREQDVAGALDAIDAMNGVGAKSVRLRIEDLGVAKGP